VFAGGVGVCVLPRWTNCNVGQGAARKLFLRCECGEVCCLASSGRINRHVIGVGVVEQAPVES
jgi:hypothetical protein